ncbi:hypothetical protein [Nocardioides sp. Leaf285]|uniref:hypothetical protein n=1 Tax=Nocardioides sp. Leaf285 TaxID=1736322 RepID=UPI0012EA213C|nr:hypothetical protein [Nocardioides sp. Leaf285]
MANKAKNKGDAAEREAVEVLRQMCPDLVRPSAMRMLGAGRKDDIGDLRVFDDVSVQVKCFAPAYMANGLREAAKGASVQRGNAIAQGFDVPFALGMIPIPRQPTSGAVRWLAAVEKWPVDLPCTPIRFTVAAKLLTWVKDDIGPIGYLAHPRERRIATHGLSLTDTVLVAPVEAWIAAYREATRRPAPEGDLGLADAASGPLLSVVGGERVDEGVIAQSVALG